MNVVPYTASFTQRSPRMAQARAVYLKAYVGGTIMVVIVLFAVLSIYWGSLWKIPDRPIDAWIVNFDDGEIGQQVVQNVLSASNLLVRWASVPAAQFPSDDTALRQALLQEKCWAAISINANASNRLASSLAFPNPSYNGSAAITLYGMEARNENAYRNIFRPTAQTVLDNITRSYALKNAAALSSQTTALSNLLTTSPQTIISPISYTIVNLRPFDQPVATAATFVGLIYLFILSYVIVSIGYSARMSSGIEKSLTFRSLIITRFVSSFLAFFTVSLFYTLLNVAFKLKMTRKFGHAGFIVFWMLNWVGMLSVGLALEAVIALLTPRFVPFFMILWIITNISVCIYPIDLLPRIYRYGYAVPFYNVSRAIRAIAFDTKNEVARNFGVLLAWVAISCLTMPIFQWIARQRDKGRVPAASHTSKNTSASKDTQVSGSKDWPVIKEKTEREGVEYGESGA